MVDEVRAGEAEIGHRIVVRPARCQDDEALGIFLAGLSPASWYQRFFWGLPRVTPKLVAGMVTVTPSRFVLLALHENAVVGHVMGIRVSEDAVDIGLVVADEYQHRGVGRRLVRELIDTAAAAGVSRLCCDVLGQNQVVLKWLRRLLHDIRYERQGPTITVHGSLT